MSRFRAAAGPSTPRSPLGQLNQSKRRVWWSSS